MKPRICVFFILYSHGRIVNSGRNFFSLLKNIVTMPVSEGREKKKKKNSSRLLMRNSATCFPLICTAGRAALEFIFCAKTKLYSACVTRSANQITAPLDKGGCAAADTSHQMTPSSVAVMSQVQASSGQVRLEFDRAWKTNAGKNAAAGPRLNDACQVILRHILRSFHLPSEKAERKGITGYGHVQISPSSP